MDQSSFEPPVTDGGESKSDTDEQGVRGAQDVRMAEDDLRYYSADGYLYAYRDEETGDHVVVSRGDEPENTWEKRIPATVARPMGGQKRWTIPDNWERWFVRKGDMINHAIFYIPESDVWAQVSIPKKDHLIDGWYGVESVGDLYVEPVGELATGKEVREIGERYEQSHDDDSDQIAAKIKELELYWDQVETELEETIKYIQDSALDDLRDGSEPIPTNSDWEINFPAPIFEPLETVGGTLSLESMDEATRAIAREEHRENDALPSASRFKVGIDESEVDMMYHVQALIEAGASSVEAVDYYMTEVEGLTQTEWAAERSVDQSTISGNVSEAKEALGPK